MAHQIKNCELSVTPLEFQPAVVNYAKNSYPDQVRSYNDGQVMVRGEALTALLGDRVEHYAQLIHEITQVLPHVLSNQQVEDISSQVHLGLTAVTLARREGSNNLVVARHGTAFPYELNPEVVEAGQMVYLPTSKKFVNHEKPTDNHRHAGIRMMRGLTQIADESGLLMLATTTSSRAIGAFDQTSFFAIPRQLVGQMFGEEILYEMCNPCSQAKTGCDEPGNPGCRIDVTQTVFYRDDHERFSKQFPTSLVLPLQAERPDSPCVTLAYVGSGHPEADKLKREMQAYQLNHNFKKQFIQHHA